MSIAKGCNPNRPAKGSITTADPIRDLAAIARIKAMLEGQPTHLTLFTLGINSAFRVSDLLSITLADIVENRLTLREKKTGKTRTVLLNEPTLKVVQDLARTRALRPQDHLFMGERGVWSVPYVSALVKRWCKAAGLVGNYSAHSLRKTFGYHANATFAVSLPTIMNCYGHASQRQTMTYLGITEQAVVDCYNNVL